MNTFHDLEESSTKLSEAEILIHSLQRDLSEAKVVMTRRFLHMIVDIHRLKTSN